MPFKEVHVACLHGIQPSLQSESKDLPTIEEVTKKKMVVSGVHVERLEQYCEANDIGDEEQCS